MSSQILHETNFNVCENQQQKPTCFSEAKGDGLVHRLESRAAVNGDEFAALTPDPATSGACRDSFLEGYSECQRYFTRPPNTPTFLSTTIMKPSILLTDTNTHYSTHAHSQSAHATSYHVTQGCLMCEN